MQELYFTFNGRIGRGRYWLGVLGLFAAVLVVSFVTAAFFTGGEASTAPIGPTRTNLVSLILSLLFLYPGAALTVKRLHDRDRAANPWLWIIIVPGVLFSFMQTYAIGFQAVEIEGQTVVMPVGVGWLVFFVMFAISLWAFIELGFRRGTQGPNRFGPDPV